MACGQCHAFVVAKFLYVAVLQLVHPDGVQAIIVYVT